MEKVSKWIRKNKVGILVFWLLLVYLIFLGVYYFCFKKIATITQILFIFATACFIYIDIIMSVEYVNNKKILMAIKNIEVRYEYLQTYMLNNNLILEVQKKEIEKLKNDLFELKIQCREFKEDDKLIQFVVDLQ